MAATFKGDPNMPMLETLKPIIDIQELDMKMVRLMRVKRERQKELKQIEELRADLHAELKSKEVEVEEIGRQIRQKEARIVEIGEKVKSLEARQSTIKKVDEFNALTQEMTPQNESGSLKSKKSQISSTKSVAEEELLHKIRDSLKTSEESSIALEKEIQASIDLINEEGTQLKTHRDALANMPMPTSCRSMKDCSAIKKTASLSRSKTAHAAAAILS